MFVHLYIYIYITLTNRLYALKCLARGETLFYDQSMQ